MAINDILVAELRQILPQERLLVNEPMSRHTTFEIGGPADYLIFPASMEEVKRVFAVLRRFDVPFTVLGNGSNVLVRDKGVRGAIIKFNSPFSYIRREGNRIIAGAGALLKDVSRFAAEAGLSGLEFAVGIPGSVGGAVFMNAGAYGGEMSDCVDKVRSVTQEGEMREFSVAALDLGYRQSVFQRNGHAICEVELTLSPGDKAAILSRMEDFTDRRETKQPLDLPSAGSTFKRPQGHYAGTLIDQTGLKGLKIGKAQVSEKHAGFVVNTGGATAADVLALIAEVQKRVWAAHGVKMQPEVRIIGEE